MLLVSSMMKDFFKINLGHVLILTVWLVTVVWGYSDLNTRVKTLENAVVVKGTDIEAIRAQMSAEAKEATREAKEAAQHLAQLHAKVSAMANDTEWIKRNMK